MKHSLLALMDAAQVKLQVDSFMAYCEDSNDGSRAVLQGLGLEPTDEVVTEPNNGWHERLYEKEITNA